MITRKFIEKIRYYFDELGIEAQQGISYEEFETQFIKALNCSQEITDASLCIYIYKYCVKKWNKIETIFNKHLSRWQEYNYNGPTVLRRVGEDDAEGVYYLTNALTKYKEIFYTSKSYDNELYSFRYKHHKFMMYDDCDFYIKHSFWNSTKMKMFDKNKNHMCNIVLSDGFLVFLEKNNTEYELVIQEKDAERPFVGVFKKSYINSLSDDEMINFENMVADIEWSLIEPKSTLGVARVTLYQEVEDISKIFYFASSIILLYRSFIKEMESVKNLALISALNTRY